MAVLPRRKLWFLVLVVIIFTALPTWSLAQGQKAQAFPETSKIDNDQARFLGPPTSGPILVSGALPMGKGNFAIQPYWYLTFQGSQFDNYWRTVSAGQDLISLNNALTLYYGFTENFWVSIFWSYYIYSRAYNIQNPDPGQGRTAEFGDTGPFSLTLRYRFLEQQRFRPTVTGFFNLGFPTGRGTKVSPGTLPAAVSSPRSWGFTWGLNLHLSARPVILYANLWYFMATIDQRERDIDGGLALEPFHPRDQIKFNMAAEIPLRWEGENRFWVLLFEMTSLWELGPIFPPGPAGNPSYKVTTLAGIEYIINPKWRLALGCSFDLLGRNTTKNFTPTFTIYKPLNLFKRTGLQN